MAGGATPRPDQPDHVGPRGGAATARLARGDRGRGFLGAFLIVLAAGVAAAPAGAAPAAPAPRRPVSPAAVVRVTAKDVQQIIRAATGRVVLVNVWATWCEPCRQEFPDLLKLRRALAGRGFELVLVSADFDTQLPQVRLFLAREGVDFTTYFKSGDDTAFINGMDPAWSGALPATFVYDRSGARRDFWEGPATYDGLLAKVGKLLGP